MIAYELVACEFHKDHWELWESGDKPSLVYCFNDKLMAISMKFQLLEVYNRGFQAGVKVHATGV